MYKREISNSDDTLDSRDVEKRLDELEDEKSDLESALSELKEELEDETDEEEQTDIKAQIESAEKALEEWEESSEGEELKELKAFWDELEGYVSGGETLIRDSYFSDYAKEFCRDVYGMEDIPDLLQNNINWEGVAEDLQADYSSAEWDGVTYWFLAH